MICPYAPDVYLFVEGYTGPTSPLGTLKGKAGLLTLHKVAPHKWLMLPP